MALITIAPLTINNWTGQSSGISLLLLINDTFTAASGTLYPKTMRQNLANGMGAFVVVVPCTISGSELTIPQIQIDSTDDSPNNPSATVSAELWDVALNQEIQCFGPSTFTIPSSSNSTTWQAIFAAQPE